MTDNADSTAYAVYLECMLLSPMKFNQEKATELIQQYAENYARLAKIKLLEELIKVFCYNGLRDSEAIGFMKDYINQLKKADK